MFHTHGHFKREFAFSEHAWQYKVLSLYAGEHDFFVAFLSVRKHRFFFLLDGMVSSPDGSEHDVEGDSSKIFLLDLTRHYSFLTRSKSSLV